MVGFERVHLQDLGVPDGDTIPFGGVAFLRDCSFEGIITPPQYFTGTWEVFNTSSVSTPAKPMVMQGNNCLSTFIFRNFSGSMVWRNITQNNWIDMSFLNGSVTFESTVTVGTAVLSGSGGLTDNSGVGFTVDSSNLLSKELISAIDFKMDKALGLAQENQYMDQTVYNGDGNLTSARIRLYSSAADVGTVNSVIATYSLVSTWNGTQLATCKVTKV